MKGTDLPVPMESEPVTYTLEPLRSDGRDALDHRRAPRIKAILLRKIKFTIDDQFHQTVTKQADDLLPGGDAHSPPVSLIPDGATPTAATFAVHLDGSPGTDAVQVIPPTTVRCHPQAHLPIILAWLKNTCLNTAQKIRRLTPVVLLALAAALAPAFDDDDPDDDDLRLRPSRSFSP